MAVPKADEMRAMAPEKLSEELNEAYRELFNLRFRQATRQLENVHEVRVVKRKIARLHTVLRERELGFQMAYQAPPVAAEELEEQEAPVEAPKETKETEPAGGELEAEEPEGEPEEQE